MILLFARVGCLIVGLGAGWAVLHNLQMLFEGWIPYAVAFVVSAIVFSVIYFPLARHIADFFSDRLSVMVHRGRHIKSGSGVDEIPSVPKQVRCTICGGPGGPICFSCSNEIK